MTIALSVKNKLGFIDGSIPKPIGNDLPLLLTWICNNNMVISWILNSISKEISDSVIFIDSTYDIWLDLKDMFQQSNGPRIFHLRRELINLHQDQNSVGVYYTKLKAIWEELNNLRPSCSCDRCTCGKVKELSTYFQMEYAMSFFMGLNDSFNQVRGQLLLLDPMPPISKVFSLVSQEENQRKITTRQILNGDSSNTMAFAARTDNSRNYNPSNSSAHSNNYKGQKKDIPFYTHCNFHGHIVDKCYKLHGYPPSYKPNVRPTSATVNQVSAQSTPNNNGDQDNKNLNVN